MNRRVYNLEFGTGTRTFAIDGYEFSRVDNYPERRAGLQQLVNIMDGEQDVRQNTGGHQHTADVEIPDQAGPTLLYKDSNSGTRLDDILLLLSIFSRRYVFSLDDGYDDQPIIADPRVLPLGGGLVCSLPRVFEFYNDQTGDLIEDPDPEDPFCLQRDISDYAGIRNILELMKSDEWQALYQDGFYLRLYLRSMLRTDLTQHFVQCWTIWEHLFALNHAGSMSERKIITTPADKKVGYIFEKYLGVSPDNGAKRVIKDLVIGRNRLVHFGKVTPELTANRMLTMIHCTEAVIAVTLGLEPSNVLNYKEKMSAMLSN